jgi:hypothetical protein
MSKLTSKKVLAATVAGLTLAGGGAAIAATQTDSPASSFLDSVAEHLGISSDELEDATRAAALDQVDQALEDGRITEDQAAELRSRIDSGDFPRLFGPGLFELRSHGGPENGPRPGEHQLLPFADKLSGVAEYLGLSETELLEQLAGGKSLAEIAEAFGKSVDGLKQAILDVARSALDEAVEKGLLTQEQADSILERLEGWVDDLVDGGIARLGALALPGLGDPPSLVPPDGGDGSGSGTSGRANWDAAA